MPNMEKVLRQKTHKDQGVQTDVRVFYCLAGTGDDRIAVMSPAARVELQTHRNSKLLGLLVARLEGLGLLSPDDLDKILLEIVL